MEFSKQHLEFIQIHYNSYTVVELHRLISEELGYKYALQHFRMQLYNAGYRKIDIQYWTNEQIDYLKDNYKSNGDKELAEQFNLKWKKIGGWTFKHIEKKRNYLRLKRTPEELFLIKEKAKAKGVYVEGVKKMWKTRGENPLGTILVWDGDKFIKTAKGYIHLRVFNYQVFIGAIPKDKIINHIDGNNLNCDPINLTAVTRSEHALKNNWRKYPSELRKSMHLLGRIKKQLKKEE